MWESFKFAKKVFWRSPVAMLREVRDVAFGRDGCGSVEEGIQYLNDSSFFNPAAPVLEEASECHRPVQPVDVGAAIVAISADAGSGCGCGNGC